MSADGASGPGAGRLLESLIALMRSDGERWTVRRVAHLAAIVLGNRVEVGDASQYVFHRARREGYDLPPFPLAGCGEIRRFFADEGVRNMPEWYAKLGIEGEEYARLHEKTLVSVRATTGERSVLLLDGLHYRQGSGFVRLEESDLIEHLDEASLARLLERVLSCAR